MKTLTSSSLSSFRDCPRKYQYAYELERVTVSEAAPLAFGKLWHSVLEQWWLDEMAAAVVYLKSVADEISAQDAAKITALLKHYNPPRERFEVLGVELPFEVKIENPNGGRSFYGYRLAGKVDVLVKDQGTGDTWIVDHKTTASEIMGFGPYWSALQIDGQMQNYCLAFEARGFVYDVVRKPGIKLCGKDEKAAKASGLRPDQEYQKRIESAIEEDREPWYQWREFPKLDSDMREARMDLWQQVEMFRACANDSRFPRNSNACVSRYGNCQYIDVCTDRASIDDDSLFRSKGKRHEEL